MLNEGICVSGPCAGERLAAPTETVEIVQVTQGCLGITRYRWCDGQWLHESTTWRNDV